MMKRNFILLSSFAAFACCALFGIFVWLHWTDKGYEWKLDHICSSNDMQWACTSNELISNKLRSKIDSMSKKYKKGHKNDCEASPVLIVDEVVSASRDNGDRVVEMSLSDSVAVSGGSVKCLGGSIKAH